MADNGPMHPRARLFAAAWAALACAGCPSLDALECHGSACGDGAAADASQADSPAVDGADGNDGATIYCGASSCTPPGSECCLANGQTSCVSLNGCNGGSDIFCDDPSQCPGGGTCWICITAGGFQGTSCNYQGDIVGNWHCDMTNALPLCHSPGQCGDAATCAPLAVAELDAGQSFFSACQ